MSSLRGELSAKVLKYLLIFLGVPFVVGPFLYAWLFYGVQNFNKINLAHVKVAGLSSVGANLAPSFLLKLLAATVDGVSYLFLVLGIIYLVKILNRYTAGELFSKNVMRLYRKLLWAAFAWTVYNPIKVPILSLVTTCNNAVGHRVLTLSFKGDDVLHIFIVGSLLVLNLLMREAYKLKQEQDLTV